MNFISMTQNTSKSHSSYNEFESFSFTHHTAPMLIIDPSYGQILDANSAAAEFYGWSQDQLRHMRIQEIDTLSEEQVFKVIEEARTLTRNNFNLKHRIADGSIRHVRVFVTKFDFQGSDLLHTIITDISEQKAEEEKLRRSEAKFRAIVENSNDGILFCDGNATITYRNPAYSRINDFTSEEQLDHSGFDILHPEDLQMLRERWNAMIVQPDSVLKAEYRIRHKDGTWRWVDTTAHNLLDNSDVQAVVVNTRDTTERKLAEQSLHKSQATLKAVIDSTIDMIWSVNAIDFGLLTWNNAFWKYYKENRGIEIKVGMRPCDLFPPGSSYIQAWENYFTQALQNGSFSTEYTVFDETRILDLNVNPLHQDDKIFSISVFGKDITERKQAEKALKESEKKFRYLFDSLPICVGITKIDTGKFLELNETSVAFTGYDMDTLNETGAANSYANPSDRDQLIQLLKQKGKVDNFETVMRRRNGTLYNALVNAKIIQLNGENVLLSNIQDITERKKTEEALRNSQRFESLGLMAGGIAHDFNNILGGIVGYADMSKDCVPADSRISTYLDKILTSADRAKNLVNQILSFSRQRADSMNPMYIRPIVNEVIGLLRATLPSSIELKCDIAKDSRPIRANSTRIHEVIMNLSVNAAYAMKNKGTLEISHTELTLESELIGKAGIIQPGFYSVISVKDTGSGISPEILSKIFEPYFTTKPFGEGTGLGLAVVLGIVQSHQGNITVESAVGKGTEFKIYLPKSDDDPIGDERDESKIRGGNERILFIDDETVLCEMIRDMLTGLGYKVTAYSDSFKALKEVRDVLNEYDLVITDQTMPKISGFELSKEFLNIRKDLPIILCTGFSKGLDESTILNAGISALCIKPIRKAEIAKKIRMVLDEKSGDVLYD
jgi:PAS domain S-box-containing protein